MRNVLALVVAGMALAGSWRMQAQGAPSLEERYRAIPDAAAIGRYMERLLRQRNAFIKHVCEADDCHNRLR